MISTGQLMLGKALLTATALLGFGLWQLRVLRRLRLEREQRRAAEEEQPADAAAESAPPRPSAAGDSATELPDPDETTGQPSQNDDTDRQP